LPHVLKFRVHADWLFSLYRFFQPRYIPSGAREKKTLDGVNGLVGASEINKKSTGWYLII
jgi:hypothetical protein